MHSWYSIRAAGKADAEILIYDEIGGFGIGAKSFVDDLNALRGVKDLTLRINSPGGDVFDAVAIYNALGRHPAHKVVWVDGFAASAASVVAMAGDEIVMPANTLMMVHEPYGMALGTAADMRKVAEALDRARRSIVNIYAHKTERAQDEIERLVVDETWMNAQEAFDLGFADIVAEPVKIAAHFDASKFHVKRGLPEPVAALLSKEEAVMPKPSVDQPAPDEPKTPDSQPLEDAPAPSAPPPPPSPPPVPQPDPIPDPAPHARPGSDDPFVREESSDASESTARASALAYAREVVDLCALAGEPGRAGEFLKAAAPIEDVRAALLRARADRDAATVIDGVRPPVAASRAAWDNVLARKFPQ